MEASGVTALYRNTQRLLLPESRISTFRMIYQHYLGKSSVYFSVQSILFIFIRNIDKMGITLQEISGLKYETMKKYNIIIDDKRHIVRVTHVGDLDISMAEKLVTDARIKAYNLGYNLLYDFRESFIKLSTFEMYFLPREHNLLAIPKAKDTKSANIIPLKDKKVDWRFFEVTAQNAGLNWRAFKNEKDALKWLEGYNP